MLKVTLTILALLVFPIHASDTISKDKLTSMLAEAEDYLSVKPSKSLKILSSQNDLSLLSEPQFFRWHIASIRASLSFNNLLMMENSIKALITHKSATEFEHRIVPILSSIGIWLRKSGYLKQAKLTLVCALKHNQIEGNKVKLLTSIAIVSRHLNQNEYAINTYNIAKSIAKNVIITVTNNTNIAVFLKPPTSKNIMKIINPMSTKDTAANLPKELNNLSERTHPFLPLLS